jgi:chemotaxis response regulator CheB
MERVRLKSMSIRILVVDDTVVFRRIVCDALASLPGVEVVGTAANGKLALARMAALEPDLVTLDIEMPEMNGIEVLEAMGPAGLKAGIIVLSSLTVQGGEMTVRSLELGAFDFLTKPEGGRPAANLAHLREQLLPMIRAFERRRDIRAMLRGNSGRPPGPDVEPKRPAAGAGEPEMVRRPRTRIPTGSDRRVHRRARRPGRPAAEAPGGPGRPSDHRAAHAGAFYRAAGGEP